MGALRVPTSFVEAAGIESMRARAGDTAPEVAAGIWRSPERFFRVGGTRDWASLLDAGDLAHFDERLRELAGDATDRALRGRVALETGDGCALRPRRPRVDLPQLRVEGHNQASFTLVR